MKVAAAGDILAQSGAVVIDRHVRKALVRPGAGIEISNAVRLRMKCLMSVPAKNYVIATRSC